MNMQVSSTDGIDTSMTEDPNGSRTTESTEHSRHHCQLNDASTCTKRTFHRNGKATKNDEHNKRIEKKPLANCVFGDGGKRSGLMYTDN
nr:unnamed protein product [Fasciola hepatica]